MNENFLKACPLALSCTRTHAHTTQMEREESSQTHVDVHVFTEMFILFQSHYLAIIITNNCIIPASSIEY